MTTYYTPELAAAAKQIIENCWEFHPEVKFADESLMLAAYEDGVWVVRMSDVSCNMAEFDKLECITSETW